MVPFGGAVLTYKRAMLTDAVGPAFPYHNIAQLVSGPDRALKTQTDTYRGWGGA